MQLTGRTNQRLEAAAERGTGSRGSIHSGKTLLHDSDWMYGRNREILRFAQDDRVKAD
jgi:hypothetical protein